MIQLSSSICPRCGSFMAKRSTIGFGSSDYDVCNCGYDSKSIKILYVGVPRRNLIKEYLEIERNKTQSSEEKNGTSSSTVSRL